MYAGSGQPAQALLDGFRSAIVVSVIVATLVVLSVRRPARAAVRAEAEPAPEAEADAEVEAEAA